MYPPTQHLSALDLRSHSDVIVAKWNGDLQAEDIRQLLLYIEGVQGVHERVYIVVDAHAGTKIEPEARKLAVSHKLPFPLAGVAIFGASLTVAILLNVLTKALRLMRGIMTPVQFVKTEEAAWEWINAARVTCQGA